MEVGQMSTRISGIKNPKDILIKAETPVTVAFQFTIVSLLSFLISYYTVGALQGQENLDATGLCVGDDIRHTGAAGHEGEHHKVPHH